MLESMENPNIYVEGNDDINPLIHLLIRHGIDFNAKPFPAAIPRFIPMGNKERLLENMPDAISVSPGKSVGFIVDADSPLSACWDAISCRLKKEAKIDVPKIPPAEGFIGYSSRFKATVGIWLMPDNQCDGKLEDFLRSLIAENDTLIVFAGEATEQAKRSGATFTDPDFPKAQLHTWLAWQQEPGCPYGTAMKAHFFRHDAPAAMAFVNWFKH